MHLRDGIFSIGSTSSQITRDRLPSNLHMLKSFFLQHSKTKDDSEGWHKLSNYLVKTKNFMKI